MEMAQKRSVLVVIAFVFLISGVAHADYTITRLATVDAGHDGTPDINAKGDVAWSDYDGNDSEIFLYSDGRITQITDNLYDDEEPQINDSGTVVWEGRAGQWWEIFLYSNGTTSILTDPADYYTNHRPQINNNNQVVWYRPPIYFGDTTSGIFLYSGGQVTKLPSSDRGTDPRINASGEVVWQKTSSYYTPSYAWVYLYTGGTASRVSNYYTWAAGAQINDRGEVVWRQGSEYSASSEIYLHSGGQMIRVTNNDHADAHPQISASGHVVWRGYENSRWVIFSYSEGATRRLSEDGVDAGWPMVNASGQVVWIAYDTFMDVRYGFLHSDGTTTRITDYNYDPGVIQINEKGQLAWKDGKDWPVSQAIYLATVTVPAGDIETTPAQLGLGDVELGSYTTGVVTVRNGGAGTLAVTSLALDGSAGPFSLESPPPTPVSVAAGGSFDVTVRFTPTAAGGASANLVIQSDDPDETTISVPIEGNGVRVAQSPGELVLDLLAFYNSSVANGTLCGTGKGNSPQGRVTSFRNKIEAVVYLVAAGKYDEAVSKLRDDLAPKCDGIGNPPDFLDGSAREELYTRIQQLISLLAALE